MTRGGLPSIERDSRKGAREREREKDMPAGEQMVAPFIGLFVGSAHVSHPRAAVPLCAAV